MSGGYYKTHFFITGLPRSRTAWLANWLTWTETFCFHDQLRNVAAPAGLRELFTLPRASHVGHSDPTNLLVQDALIEAFPQSLWVIVERDPAAVFESCKRAFEDGVSMRVIDALLKKTEQLKTKVWHRTIAYEDLDSGKMLEISTIINPRFNSPAYRNRMLQTMNVQVDPAYMRAEIAKLNGAPLPIHAHLEP